MCILQITSVYGDAVLEAYQLSMAARDVLVDLVENELADVENAQEDDGTVPLLAALVHRFERYHIMIYILWYIYIIYLLSTSANSFSTKSTSTSLAAIDN